MTEGLYYVKNWWRHQHYRDLSVPWIKLKKSVLYNPHVQSLKIEDRWRLLILWLIASEHEGTFSAVKAELRQSLGVATNYQAVGILDRIEATGLISQQDIRGVKRVPSRKILQSTSILVDEKPSPKPKLTVFVKPEIAAVEAYMTEQGFGDPAVTAQKFLAYYESNGWKVGRNSMKSWKGAVITWKHRETPKLDWGSV